MKWNISLYGFICSMTNTQRLKFKELILEFSNDSEFDIRLKKSFNDFKCVDILNKIELAENAILREEKLKLALSKNESTIPKERWGVHETHCCLAHGCKYGNEDCPVTMELTKQVYPCEECGEADNYY